MYRLNDLIKTDRKLYHTGDLALLWEINNKNTLYTTIKRYVKKGVLVPVFKGLYATVPIDQVNPVELGKAIIHRYTYLSTESVLSKNGIIFQAVYNYTFVSSVSKKLQIDNTTFLYRKLKDEYLFNPTGIEKVDEVYIATTERAVADMLYFDQNYHFDMHDAIDWKRVAEIQKEVYKK